MRFLQHQYISKYWARHEDWCLTYRGSNTHGHQTNNFSEVCVRLYKDIVLSRCKTYNLVALVDFTCTTMEQYYIRRLRDFANRRYDEGKHLLKVQFKNASYLKKDILKIDEFTYKVPSEKNDLVLYDVNIEIGRCSCLVGRLGKTCKHQAGVYLFYYDIQTNDSENSYQIARLALGEKAKSREFYKPLISAQKINFPSTSTDNIDLYDQHSVAEVNTSMSHENKPLSDDQNSFNDNAESSSFEAMLKLMQEYNKKFGTAENSVKKYLSRLQRVTTRNAWDSFLCSAGCSIPLRRCRVQRQPQLQEDLE